MVPHRVTEQDKFVPRPSLKPQASTLPYPDGPDGSLLISLPDSALSLALSSVCFSPGTKGAFKNSCQIRPLLCSKPSSDFFPLRIKAISLQWTMRSYPSLTLLQPHRPPLYPSNTPSTLMPRDSVPAVSSACTTVSQILAWFASSPSLGFLLKQLIIKGFSDHPV